MKKIYIDPGHGGKDSGAVGNGLLEKNLNLNIAKEIKKYLDENYAGHETTLTRSTDVFIELSERANMANRSGAMVFISNHVNAGGGTGYESYIYTKPSAGSVKLQSLVNAEALATAKKYGLDAHGDDSKNGNLAVVRETNMPAILTEIAYIDSNDAESLKNKNFINDMAAAYARGVAKFINLEAKKATGTDNNKGDVDEMSQPFKPSTSEAANAVLRVLSRFEQKDPALSATWREKQAKGELTIAQALELVYVAIDRGYITGKTG